MSYHRYYSQLNKFVYRHDWYHQTHQGSKQVCLFLLITLVTTPAAFNNPLPGSEPQNRLPGGGVFQLPKTNATFQSDKSSNNSNNISSIMHSDVEKVTAENNIGDIERGELDCRSMID